MASIVKVGIFTYSKPPICRQSKVLNGISGFRSVSFFSGRTKKFPTLHSQPAPLRFRVSCVAKSDTLDKVCEIVKQQLALPEGTAVTGESTFSALGADSLDTVEIVMSLEEVFGINVEEENAQSITTVQDAADLIEKLVEAKSS
nr:acyl carrier protein 3 [Erycina pusilla]WDA53415.1 acyl carrier protein 4 [Erycina pusilla]